MLGSLCAFKQNWHKSLLDSLGCTGRYKKLKKENSKEGGDSSLRKEEKAAGTVYKQPLTFVVFDCCLFSAVELQKAAFKDIESGFHTFFVKIKFAAVVWSF